MRERGQASLEYVAAMGLVAVLVVTTAALVRPDAGGLVNATLGQFRRALCLVTGASCPVVAPEPCVVSSRNDRHHYALTVTVVRLDDDHSLLREHLSDGTVRLTITGHGGAGLQETLGARLRLPGVSIGTETDLTISALLGGGRVFLAHDDRAADRLEGQLRSHLPYIADRAVHLFKRVTGRDDGPRPDATFTEGGIRAGVEVRSGSGVEGGLGGLGTALVGVRRERATGRRKLYLSEQGSLHALVSGAVGGDVGGQVTGLLELELDRRGHPVRLGLVATGEVSGSVALPSSLQGLLALGTPQGSAAPSPSHGRGRRWEVDARVDLADPRVAAAWAAFRRDPASPAAIGALGAALHDRASTQVRAYATRGGGQELGGSVGAVGGAKVDSGHEDSRLISASDRPVDGAWERRLDCLPTP